MADCLICSRPHYSSSFGDSITTLAVLVIVSATFSETSFTVSTVTAPFNFAPNRFLTDPTSDFQTENNPSELSVNIGYCSSP